MEYELDILANGRHPPRLKNNLNEIKADFNKHPRQPDQHNNQKYMGAIKKINLNWL